MAMVCGLCGSKNKSRLFRSGAHQLVRCSNCGLVYTDSFKEGETSYAGADYFIEKNQYVTRWGEFSAIFESLMQKLERFKQEGAFLDVGAGVGVLLSVAARHGFAVSGVELSEWASTFARTEMGLPVLTGTLEEAHFETEAFDVVVLNHVIEHVSDPRKLLAEIHRIMRPDGLLVIGVPNIGSIMAYLRRGKWKSLRPEEHVWHFTPATLRQLASQMGFVERFFESRENMPVAGWGLKSLLRRFVNAISVLTGRSEAMLLFATKKAVVEPSKRTT